MHGDLTSVLTAVKSKSHAARSSLQKRVIMEALGGGGHQTMAAAQLKHITPEAARSRIETAIDNYWASQKKSGAEEK